VRIPRRDLVALVAAGGMLGALARYGLIEAIHTPAHGVPWVTFGVNLSGAFVLGAFSTITPAHAHRTRAFVAVGVLGAYTTFSTLAIETVLLMKAGRVGLGISYLAGTIVIGLACAQVGVWCGRAVSVRGAQ
jgi:CrcB protein